MKATRRVITLAVMGAGLLAGVLALAMWLAGGSGGPAQAQTPITVGFDMNTAGNSCPGTGAANCTLGAIDACVEVATGGAVITVDVFLQDLPAGPGGAGNRGGFAGFQYHIAEKTDQTVGTVAAISHKPPPGAPDNLHLVFQVAPTSGQEFSDPVGTSIPSWDALVADLGGLETNPPFTKGVVSRLGIDTTGTPDGVYGLVIDLPGTGAGLQVLDSNADDYCAVGSPAFVGCNILDANTSVPEPHGIIAIGVNCPDYADAEIISQVVRAANCTGAAPTEIPVDTDTTLCLRKSIRNNGPETPVDVDVDADLSIPGDCTVSGGAPHTVTGVGAGTVTVDELFTINCDSASTHNFTFNNEIDVATTDVIDPDLTNNIEDTAFSLSVLGVADLAITGATVAAPASAVAGGTFQVSVTADLTNTGYGPVTGTATLYLTVPGDCTKNPNSSQNVNRTGLGTNTATANWTVSCTNTGSHTMNSTGNTVALATTTHVSETNTANNGPVDDPDGDTMDITASADVQATSYSFFDDMPSVGGTQVRVVPGTAEDISDAQTMVNAGPFSPVDVSDARTVGDVVGCGVTPNSDTDPFTLTISIPVTTSATWSVLMDPSVLTFCTLTFQKALTITTANVGDPTPGNNTRSAVVILVRDADNDTVPDDYNGVQDNCPAIANPTQADQDLDGIGDACDDDVDGDTIPDATDNCPLVPNADQADTDGNGIGDACENDYDGDGVPDAEDNCRNVSNPSQTDTDNDGIGNVCDNCPLVANPGQADGDANGVGDACEVTPTPVPTTTVTVTTTATATATGTTTPEGTPTPPGETCAPVIPGTYNGLVRLDGVPAAEGLALTASIGGVEWGSTSVAGGRYALDIPESLPTSPPCFAGGTITFALNGGVCEEAPEWAAGLHDLDLNCAAALSPTPPPATATPPVGPPPSGTVKPTPAAMPPTGTGVLGPLSGLPWALTAGVGAFLMWVLAAAGVLHTVRRRSG